MDDDRRQHPRIELVAQAEIATSDVLHLLRVVNASRGGVFLRATPENYPDFREGIEVKLHLMPESDDDEKPDLNATGKIVRVQTGDDAGFAIEFTQIEDTHIEILETLLASRK